MDSDFAAQVDRAATALQKNRRRLGGLVIAGAIGLAVFWIASGAELPFAVFPSFLLTGGGVVVFLSGASRARRLRAAAEQAPDWWFVSDSAGLVFFGKEGAFAEKSGGFHPYDTDRRKLKSISYDEERHALLLQVRRLIRDRYGDRETYDRHFVPLPREIAPELALKQAVAANKRAAQA